MWVGWIHHSWRFGHVEALHEVGPKVPEHRSKMSMVPVWAILEFFWHDPNDFLLRLVTTDKTLLYHYDLETKQQSMEWWYSSSLHPKKFLVEKSTGKVLVCLDFLGSRRHPPSLIIFERAKLSTRSITHFCWCNWRTFWRKNAMGDHQGGLVLAWQCPVSPVTCNSEETGLPGLPVSWSPTLFSGSGPVGLPPVPWTEKTI